MSGIAGQPLHVLIGPTACGKSAVAQYIAERRGAAVLSADAMLIYRGMDIGTAKPSQAERGSVPYLGVDLAWPDEVFGVWQYRQAVVSQLAALPPAQEIIAVGGSGLYVKALINGLDEAGPGPVDRERWAALFAAQGVEGLQEALRERDPDALAALADARNPRRLIRALERLGGALPSPSGARKADGRERADMPVLAGLWIEPVLLNARIACRVEEMYAAGLLDEVAGLLASGRALSPTARQAIGYAEAIDVLEGRCRREAAMERTVTRTRQLAKRQRTWFRHQARVEWVDVKDGDPVDSIAERVQELWGKYGSARLA